MNADDLVAVVRLRADVRAGLVREVRERAGLSQAEVANAVGAHRATVTLWEQGRRVPHGQAAVRYAHLLDKLRQEVGEGAQ